jgi:2-C-methyl-D-erythritol 4-phosphate cytidylyltransferase
MSNTVIVVAGGVGQRMGSLLPKQFLLLGGKPVIIRSLLPFVEFDPEIEIIIVLPKEHVSVWKSIANDYGFHVEHKIVHGGDSRFQSVYNGLQVVENDGFIAVHDSVRPFVNRDFVEKCFLEAKQHGTVIPCVQVAESVRQITAEGSVPLQRDKIRLVQTPQVFKTSLLMNAYHNSTRGDYSDDASVVEAMGEKVHLVEGIRENIKITIPSDLAFAEWKIKNL